MPLRSRAPQRLTSLRAGVLAVVDRHDAVDEHPLDARRKLHRLLVRRAILQRVVVEDRDVRPIADGDRSAIRETHPRRRPAGHLANRFGQREDVPLLHVARDDARKVSEAARMRKPGLVGHADAQHRARVAPDARPRKAQRRLDVLLAHHVIDRHHATAALDDEIPRRVRGLLAHLFRDL